MNNMQENKRDMSTLFGTFVGRIYYPNKDALMQFIFLRLELIILWDYVSATSLKSKWKVIFQDVQWKFN